MFSAMKTPAVTVLVDTYNHELFIEEAIVSVLEQDLPASETEILVVDDGSTDSTPEVVRKFAPRVRYVRKENGGQASAFNFGIPLAQGEIIAFLDGDDWWAKSKLSKVVQVLSSRPDIGVIGHGIYEVDSHTGHMSATLPEQPGDIDLHTTAGAGFFRHMMCFFGTSRVTIRKRVAQRALPIPEELVIEADEFMSTLSAAYSKASLIQEPLTYYRLHTGNLFQIRSSDTAKSRRIHQVIVALAKALEERLPDASVPPDSVRAIVEQLQVGATRMRLMLDGGWPWETFRSERAGFRLAYKDGGVAYKIFKLWVLGATLVLPPRLFFKVRDWYSSSSLRKMRSALGEPTPNAAIVNLPQSVEPDRRKERAR
jgi:glycosyltransferase involved in cell wall biosynthesis